MSEIAGRGATVTMNGVKLNVSSFTFPAGSLKFEGATEHEAIPPSSNVEMTFKFTWDYSATMMVGNGIWPEWLWRSMGRLRAMLARRERKRWRRYQRQKRKGG